jgi:hypothetical protein
MYVHLLRGNIKMSYNNNIWGIWQRKKINECGVTWTKRERREEEEERSQDEMRMRCEGLRLYGSR